MSGFGTFRTSRDVRLESGMRERDSTGLNHARRPFSCLSIISGQTLRVCPEGKPVPTFPDRALIKSVKMMDRPVTVADTEAIGRRDRGADPGFCVANSGFP